MNWLMENWGLLISIGGPIASFVALQFKMYYTLNAACDTLSRINKVVEEHDRKLDKHAERLSEIEGYLERTA